MARWIGSAKVERGTHWLARLTANLFGFPTATDGEQTVPIWVDIKSDASRESWTRTFGNRSFRSMLCVGKGRADKLLTESFGPFTFGLALVLENGKLHYIVRSWQLLNIPLPRLLAPSGGTYESADDGQFCFHIEIRLPWAGLVVKYVGRLEPQLKSPVPD